MNFPRLTKLVGVGKVLNAEGLQSALVGNAFIVCLKAGCKEPPGQGETRASPWSRPHPRAPVSGESSADPLSLLHTQESSVISEHEGPQRLTSMSMTLNDGKQGFALDLIDWFAPIITFTAFLVGLAELPPSLPASAFLLSLSPSAKDGPPDSPFSHLTVVGEGFVKKYQTAINYCI